MSSLRSSLSLLPLGLVLSCAPALAGDEIGIFFDARGEENCLQADPYAQLTAYLVLLDPSARGGVSGWECSVEMAEGMILSIGLVGEAIDVDWGQTDFAVGVGTPLTGSAVHLATMQVMTTGQQSGFYIYPNLNHASLEGSPVYVDGYDRQTLIPLTPHRLVPDGIVAGINAWQCFPAERSWAEVKGLYR